MDDETTAKPAAAGPSSAEPLAPVTPEEQVQEPVVEETPPEEVAPTEEEPQRQTRFERREERHIERLTDQIQKGLDRREGYRQTLEQPRPPYQPLKYEEAEYDARELEADRSRYGENRYQEGLQAGTSAAQQEFFIDRLERDGDYIASHYPQLDQSSEEFDPDLTDEINRLYLATIGYNAQTGFIANPAVRYRDFARTQMALIERVATSKGAETAQNLARQSGRGGVRPTSSPRRQTVRDLTPRSIAEMSPEEWEQNRDAVNRQILDELSQ